MINRKVAMRRIGACVIGGAVFSLPLLTFMRFESDIRFCKHGLMRWARVGLRILSHGNWTESAPRF